MRGYGRRWLNFVPVKFLNFPWRFFGAALLIFRIANVCHPPAVNCPKEVILTQKSLKMPDEGFVRLGQIIKPHGPLPVSRSHWLQGVKDGRYPQAIKISARITAWRVEDIRTLLKTLGE